MSNKNSKSFLDLPTLGILAKLDYHISSFEKKN